MSLKCPTIFAVSFQLCHMPSGLTPKRTQYPLVFALDDDLHFPQLKKKKKNILGLSQCCCVQSKTYSHLWNKERCPELLWQRARLSLHLDVTFPIMFSERHHQLCVPACQFLSVCLLEWGMYIIELFGGLNLTIPKYTRNMRLWLQMQL